AADEAVLGLQGDRAGRADPLSDVEPFADALGAVVGDGDVPDLAFGDEVVEGGDGLLERRVRVVEVGVVYVDGVGAEALEGGFGGGFDVRSGEALELGVLGDLGGDEDVLVAVLGEPGADDGLGLAAGVAGGPGGVGVGGVDEVAA
ncbi:hypothetical protein ADL26_11585, partial [Thermoactinomyces vulgaris]